MLGFIPVDTSVIDQQENTVLICEVSCDGMVAARSIGPVSLSEY